MFRSTTAPTRAAVPLRSILRPGHLRAAEVCRWAIPVIVAWAGAAMTLASMPVPLAAQEDVRVELKLRVEQLRETGSLRIGGDQVRNPGALADLYELRRFAPAWTDAARVAELERAIGAVNADGLDPADYRAATLRTLRAGSSGAAVLADLDLVRTDALLRLVHDVRYGRAPALGGAALGAACGTPTQAELAELARRVLDSNGIRDAIVALRPTHFTYVRLVEALAELRRTQAAGGWERIADGPALRPGSADPRVLALRRRLAAGGDLPPGAAPSDTLFDARVEAALRRFQHRHALNDDGVLGPATRTELNVPVERRIEQVRVNLERARWLVNDLPPDFVAVNIAGAMVYLVRGGQVAFETRTVVGRTYTRTPVFRAEMRYIDLNPTWTVPPGIVREVLTDARRDPDYLRRLDMRVLDRWGRPVQLSAAALGRYSASSFPYILRQQPGPLNPLGQIKFIFPNPYNVYLHDTPSKGLFEREQRTFSHGCIRVQDPRRLAELVLNDPARWSRGALDSAIAGGRTRTITLETPLPVLVLYWTALADLHGELHFYRDVYGRDEAVLRALGSR
jgi:L,D-transpeptidase YcbB